MGEPLTRDNYCKCGTQNIFAKKKAPLFSTSCSHTHNVPLETPPPPPPLAFLPRGYVVSFPRARDVDDDDDDDDDDERVFVPPFTVVLLRRRSTLDDDDDEEEDDDGEGR